MTIKVILADDHQIIRDGLGAILEKEADIQVVATAQDGREAIQKCLAQKPDVVVMDINMPLLNGIDAARQLHNLAPELKVVILSMHANKELIYQALRAGVKGYLLKATSAKELVIAIRAVGAGNRYLSNSIADTMIDDYVDQRQSRDDRSPIEQLSGREREVLQLVVEGKTSAEIGALLFLSISTINTYRSRIIKKLGVKDKTGLVKFALEHGLFDG